MKPTNFVNREFYHVYNRGVDKRQIFLDQYDIQRFLQSILEFNSAEPIGSIYELSFLREKPQFGRPTSKLRLVDIIAYCLNPNHYHLILKQKTGGGISEYMKRLGGYTKYFNHKYKRSGVLFQGGFKSRHIKTNEYLLHVNAYVNLNYKVHKLDQFGRPTSKLNISSWNEYISKTKENLCKKDIILSQFKNIREYKEFAENSLEDILERKENAKELWNLFLD